MEKKVVQFEIGKVFAVIIAIVAVAIIAAMVLQGGYFKGELVLRESADKIAVSDSGAVITDVKVLNALTEVGSDTMSQMYIHGNDLMVGQMKIVHSAGERFQIELMKLRQEKTAIAFGEIVAGYDRAIAAGRTHTVAIKNLMMITARDLGIEDKGIVIALEAMKQEIEKGVGIELMNFSKVANNELMVLAKNTAGLSREFPKNAQAIEILAKEITLTANKVLDFTYGMALTINTNLAADEVASQFVVAGISALPYKVQEIALPWFDAAALDAQQFDGVLDAQQFDGVLDAQQFDAIEKEALRY